MVLASPVNYYNVTALFRRFQERLLGYIYWPWGQNGPTLRNKRQPRKAVLVASAGMPGFLIPLATGAPRALRISGSDARRKTSGQVCGSGWRRESRTTAEQSDARTRAAHGAEARVGCFPAPQNWMWDPGRAGVDKSGFGLGYPSLVAKTKSRRCVTLFRAGFRGTVDVLLFTVRCFSASPDRCYFAIRLRAMESRTPLRKLMDSGAE